MKDLPPEDSLNRTWDERFLDARSSTSRDTASYRLKNAKKSDTLFEGVSLFLMQTLSS